MTVMAKKSTMLSLVVTGVDDKGRPDVWTMVVPLDTLDCIELFALVKKRFSNVQYIVKNVTFIRPTDGSMFTIRELECGKLVTYNKSPLTLHV